MLLRAVLKPKSIRFARRTYAVPSWWDSSVVLCHVVRLQVGGSAGLIARSTVTTQHAELVGVGQPHANFLPNLQEITSQILILKVTFFKKGFSK